MTLYTAIRRGATMLLPGNWELRRDDIARLQKRCPEVRVQVRDPDLDDIVPFDEASDEQAYVEAAMTRATACASEVMKIANDSSPNRSRRFGQDQWQVCKGQASLCIHLTAPLAPCNRAQHNSGSNRHRARHRLACHRDGQRTRVIVVPSHILHARTQAHASARTRKRARKRT